MSLTIAEVEFFTERVDRGHACRLTIKLTRRDGSIWRNYADFPDGADVSRIAETLINLALTIPKERDG